jgi:hypothetical protein
MPAPGYTVGLLERLANAGAVERGVCPGDQRCPDAAGG